MKNKNLEITINKYNINEFYNNENILENIN